MPLISPAVMVNKQASKPLAGKSGGKASLMHRSDLPPGAAKRYKLRNAAVLIPLLRQADEWHVLFIRRSKNKKDRHSGQVAFPGGSCDANDNGAIDTALRETREEVGIRRDKIRVVGVLPDYETTSYFRVTPVVGLLQWPCTMKLQDSEVARAFTIPLDWLLDDSHYQLRERAPVVDIAKESVAKEGVAKESAAKSEESKRPPVVYFDEYDGELLWGASARMTLNFLHALRHGELLIPGYSYASAEPGSGT